MKVWTAVFDIVAVLIMVMLLSYYLNVSTTIDTEFNQARYEYAIRQATEAMFKQAIESEDIELDYSSMTYVNINASNGLEIFDRVICANYNMSYCDDNCNEINQSIAACVIAGYDGYYITEMSESDDIKGNGSTVDNYTLRFSPKYPFYVEAGGRTYAVDTYKNTYASLASNTLANIGDTPKVSTKVGDPLPAGLTKERVNKAINVQIRDKILSEIYSSDNVALKDYTQFRLYFPDDRTVTGVNPFEVPGIFVMMQGADFAKTEGMTSIGVAGFKVVPKQKVVLFTDTRTGRHYYCMQGQLKEEEKDLASGGVVVGGVEGKFHIDDYVYTVKEAAEATYNNVENGEHYYPYYDILVRKIQE